jgi:hypothetical protein
MGDKLLARAFALVTDATKDEEQGKAEAAREKLTAAVGAFEACLRMPGFVTDPKSRALMETQVKEIKARKEAMVGVKAASAQLEKRMDKLQHPDHEDNLRERLDALSGLDKPVVPVENLEARLRALKADKEGAAATSAMPKVPPAFANDEWKRGLDPEVAALIEQVRDETFPFE